ncbi:MAG: ABC transporter ATP-binding protein [Chthoniobacterales bacterium]
MNVFLRVLPYLRKYRLMAIGMFSCAVLMTLLVICFPVITQKIIDDVITKKQPQLLVPLMLAGFGTFFLQDLLNSLRILLNNHFEQRVIVDLRSDLYGHIQSLPLNWFDHRSTGDIMTRLLEDVTSVERVLIDGVEQGLVSCLQIIIVGALMIYSNPLLAAVAAAPLPLMLLGAIIFTATARQRYRKQRMAASAMNTLLADNLAGIRQIKTYVSEKSEHQRFDATSNHLRQMTLNVMRVWAIYNPSMSFLNSCGMVLVVSFGAYQVLYHDMPAGILVAFLMYVRFLYEPISRLHNLNQLFQSGRAAGERVFEIMDAPSEPGIVSEKSEPPLRGDVVFDKIEFHYAENMPVLHDISLHAKPGEMIALVGPTGAGKSSVVNLLVRFYEYLSGDILLDGRPLRDLPRNVLRQSIAVVTQESFLFNGTTAENLRVGKPDATEEEMWEALRSANADAFVRRMPKGLHSSVGERGIRLSVGEKQRISIARALLKNPPILILDEATASVDTETERLIQQALDRLMQTRTSFVIAHRLSTVRHADQILVMERGKIIERGRHEELFRHGGLYTKLCQSGLIGAEENKPPAKTLPV